MSNTNASEDNVESPSTYGNESYKEYRKKEKSKDAATSSQNEANHIEGRELEEGQSFQY
jgi:hypothetical protein